MEHSAHLLYTHTNIRLIEELRVLDFMLKVKRKLKLWAKGEKNCTYKVFLIFFIIYKTCIKEFNFKILIGLEFNADEIYLFLNVVKFCFKWTRRYLFKVLTRYFVLNRFDWAVLFLLMGQNIIIMVLRLDSSSEKGAHKWMVFRFVDGIGFIEKVVKSDFFLRKRPIFFICAQQVLSYHLT